jgi:hypothetical protein
MTDTKKITASFTFCGREFSDVECVNPGDWFGKTWAMEIGGSYAPFFVVVEADSITDAIDELIDSKYGAQFIIDPADYADYGYTADNDNPDCSFAGNNGHPVDLQHLMAYADDAVSGHRRIMYHVDGWPVPVKPTELRDVQDKMEQRDEYRAQVSGPGKFEGEAPYVPYFWDAYLNGAADDDTNGILTFNVTDEDRALFPELADRDAVYLYEDDNGFVGEADGPAEDVDDMSGRFDS